jgi:hypothetical protein
LAKHLTRIHMTALGWNANTGMLENLGDGTMTCETETVDNKALLDTEKDPEPTVKSYTFTGEMRSASSNTGWLAQVQTVSTLVFTSAQSNINGPFLCVSCEEKDGDTMRVTVKLESKAGVVCS